MNFTRVHDEMAAMRLDLERGIRKLEELFPTKPAASTTPTPTASTTTTASLTTTPTAAARTMEEEARIHNKLDRCIQMLRETRMGMEFLSSSASSTTSDISTTASSTTTLPRPPPAAPTSTATTRAHSQTLPTRCSTPGPEHALAFANAGMATSSISSCTPIAASTSPLPPTTAAPTSTPAQAVLEVEKDVFTTTPTRCLTTRSSHDSMHKLEKNLNKCYPFEIVQHRYTNSSPASSFDEVLPTARGWDAHDGISVKKSVSDTSVDKGQWSYILKFEQVWIHPKTPWPIVCLAVVRFWSQSNFGWVTGQQRPPWPPLINSEIQDAGVPFRPPPWPSFTGHTMVVCIVNQLMLKHLIGDISGECLHPGVELYGTVMQIDGIKGTVELQFSSSITGKFWDADVFKWCSRLPLLCNTLWQYWVVVSGRTRIELFSDGMATAQHLQYITTSCKLPCNSNCCLQLSEMCDSFSVYFVHSSSPELQSWSCAVGKQLQVSVIQWSIAWRFSIDERIFGFTNLVQELANVLWVTSINLGSLTTIVKKHVIVQWRQWEIPWLMTTSLNWKDVELNTVTVTCKQLWMLVCELHMAQQFFHCVCCLATIEHNSLDFDSHYTDVQLKDFMSVKLVLCIEEPTRCCCRNEVQWQVDGFIRNIQVRTTMMLVYVRKTWPILPAHRRQASSIKILLSEAGNIVSHYCCWIIQIQFTYIGMGSNPNWPEEHMSVTSLPVILLEHGFQFLAWQPTDLTLKFWSWRWLLELLQHLSSEIWECSSASREHPEHLFKYKGQLAATEPKYIPHNESESPGGTYCVITAAVEMVPLMVLTSVMSFTQQTTLISLKGSWHSLTQNSMYLLWISMPSCNFGLLKNGNQGVQSVWVQHHWNVVSQKTFSNTARHALHLSRNQGGHRLHQLSDNARNGQLTTQQLSSTANILTSSEDVEPYCQHFDNFQAFYGESSATPFTLPRLHVIHIRTYKSSSSIPEGIYKTKGIYKTMRGLFILELLFYHLVLEDP